MPVFTEAPDSMFAFVVVAGKRARQLMSGASPLVLNAKLETGAKYQVVCESSDTGVKAFLRQESNRRVVSNVAESSLMPAPATYPSPPQLFQIPATRRR